VSFSAVCEEAFGLDTEKTRVGLNATDRQRPGSGKTEGNTSLGDRSEDGRPYVEAMNDGIGR
jgi:hypothetical protein